MYPLFESLCIQNGRIMNSNWHEKRFQEAYFKYFGESSQFNLLSEINIPKEFKKGKKERMSKNKDERKRVLEKYPNHFRQKKAGRRRTSVWTTTQELSGKAATKRRRHRFWLPGAWRFRPTQPHPTP